MVAKKHFIPSNKQQVIGGLGFHNDAFYIKRKCHLQSFTLSFSSSIVLSLPFFFLSLLLYLCS